MTNVVDAKRKFYQEVLGTSEGALPVLEAMYFEQGGPGGVDTPASNVTVVAGTGGLSASSVQQALQALATRVQALEDV